MESFRVYSTVEITYSKYVQSSDKKQQKSYRVKYAIVAAYVSKLSLTTAKEVPSLTIMLVVPTVLRV